MNRVFGGLQPTPRDDRDLKFGAFFALPDLNELPPEYYVGDPLSIKDQGSTDFCAGYASAAVVEDHEGIGLIPEFIYAMSKEISGADPDSWGTDLRSVCKAVTKIGCVDITNMSEDLVSMLEDPSKSRRPENWPEYLRTKAVAHKQLSYFSVTDSGHDTFDDFRLALWQSRDEKRSILTGAVWNEEWTSAVNGIIDRIGTPAFGHAFKIFGWKVIDGKTYLMGQLSNGDRIGDKGLFYFSRDIVNECFTFGGFTFRDMPIEQVKKNEGWFQWFLRCARTYFAEFFR